ncbi:hypothetical protein NIES2100_14440 [Calothrix sp. NIES-2100]|uniref:hypothetical protein n=1 Tax=Calothrix sp. NIES-2100 TaxID=1954172 RepID=UPI000B5E0B74|nr:hypothetical protein NIES2100_14440 [Calothrix sp. NIES-2100]
MRVVELNNKDNWEDLYYTDIAAIQVPLQNGRYLLNPISEIVIPFSLDKFILAVNIETDIPEGSIWNFAGYINQKISTGLVVGGSQDATLVKGKVLFLDRINLILFDKISTLYATSIKVPRWFPRAKVTVWQYIGVDDTSEEILSTQEFANINFKLDQLLSR